MKIDIWSDIVCPFCYIGRTHLEKAIEGFAQSEALRSELEIVWHSFELDAHFPQGNTTPLPELVAAKYGIDVPQAERQHEMMAAQAANVGLTFNWREAKPGNTFDAHRVGHLAAEKGLADAYEMRLMKAYFTDGLVVEDHDVITRLAVEIGLPQDEVRAVLDSDRYADAVRSDELAAQQIGIQGVPFFVFDEKFAVSGAQPIEVFDQALTKAWGERPARFDMVGPEGSVCGPDGCELPPRA